RRRGLPEPVRHGAHPRYLGPARDRQVVAPMEEGKAQPELLDGHLGCRSHEGLTLGCEGAVQVDIRKLAADADATGERLSAEEVVVVEHPGPRALVDRDAPGGGTHDVQLRRVARVLFGR